MSNKIQSVEIFAAGTHNGMTFTESDLDGIAAAFSALQDAGRVPLKFGHNDQQPITDGQPALGWVNRVWRNGKKLLADFVDVPTVVFEVIRKGLYKQVSIELLKKVSREGSSYPWVLDAVALLGADKPAVKGLRDLQTLTMIRQIPGVRFGQVAAFTLGNNFGDKSIMTEEEIKALQKRVADAEAKNAQLEADNKAAEKARFAEKVSEHRKVLNGKLNAAVEEGRIDGRIRDRIQKSRYFTDDQEVLTQYTVESLDAEIKDNQRADFKEAKKPTSHAGTTEDFSGKLNSEVVVFKAEAKCVALGGKITDPDAMQDAVQRVLREDPKLARAHFDSPNGQYEAA